MALVAGVAAPSVAQTPADFVPYKQTDLRLPSVPLLVNDPFFSIWSNYDALNGGPTRLWCEHEKAIDGILRVDGTAYRFMGTGRDVLLSPIAGQISDGYKWQGKVSRAKQNGTGWTAVNFNDGNWATENASWGSKEGYGNRTTEWSGENTDIYVRREIELTADDLAKELWVAFSHFDVFELYLDGKQVTSTGETWIMDEKKQIPADVVKSLTPGKHVLAAHCHNTTGGAYLDFGIYTNE